MIKLGRHLTYLIAWQLYFYRISHFTSSSLYLFLDILMVILKTLERICETRQPPDAKLVD